MNSDRHSPSFSFLWDFFFLWLLSFFVTFVFRLMFPMPYFFLSRMIDLASFATSVKSVAIETTRNRWQSRRRGRRRTWKPDLSWCQMTHMSARVGLKFVVLHLMYVITCKTRTQVTQTLLNLRSRCRLRLLLMSLSLIHQRGMSFVACSWLSCRRFKAMSLVGIYL